MALKHPTYLSVTRKSQCLNCCTFAASRPFFPLVKNLSSFDAQCHLGFIILTPSTVKSTISSQYLAHNLPLFPNTCHSAISMWMTHLTANLQVSWPFPSTSTTHSQNQRKLISPETYFKTMSSNVPLLYATSYASRSSISETSNLLPSIHFPLLANLSPSLASPHTPLPPPQHSATLIYQNLSSAWTQPFTLCLHSGC